MSSSIMARWIRAAARTPRRSRSRRRWPPSSSTRPPAVVRSSAKSRGQAAIDHDAIVVQRRCGDEISRHERDFFRYVCAVCASRIRSIVFERDPGGVTPRRSRRVRYARPASANGSFVVACKDARPQFGKDDVDVIRFASIRFDHALDEDDSLFSHACARFAHHEHNIMVDRRA